MVPLSLPGKSTGIKLWVTSRIEPSASDLSCQITLSNVRTKAEDDQHSIALSEHPLYENVEDGVE